MRMRRAGEGRDNKVMESFFSRLKTERTARKVYRSREEARSDVFDYIKHFYNPTLGYVCPIHSNWLKKRKGKSTELAAVHGALTNA